MEAENLNMIFLQLKIWKLALELDIDWFFTKWYLPIEVAYERSFSSAGFVIGFLWIFHIGIGFPTKSSAKEAQKYLPNYYRG